MTESKEQAPSIQSATARNTKIALLILGVLSIVFLFSRLAQIGIWEPWEAYDILVAQEYRSRAPSSPLNYAGHNWAVPTFEGKPIGFSLLKLWLLDLMLPKNIEDVRQLLGTLEFRSRVPFSLGLVGLIFGVFFWVKKHAGVLAGALSATTLLCFPVVFIGAHSVNTPTLLIITTSLALMALSQIIYGQKKWIWTIVFGVSLAATALDSRAFGILLIFGVSAAWALTQLAFGATEREDKQVAPSKAQWIAGALVLSLPILRLIMAWASGGAHMKKPHILQQLYLMAPICLIIGSLIWARRTKVGQTLLSAKGAVASAIMLVALVPVLIAYADVNPTLLKNGEVFGKIPVLSFLLEHHLFHNSFAKTHVHFDLWLRQIGFATFPWIALIPHGLGYMSRASRRTGAEHLNTPILDIQRMLIVWALLSFVLTAAASAHGHFFYPSYVPLAIGVGLMLADKDFWTELRARPLLLFAMGFVSVVIIMMLGKDIERYPNRFLELYASFEKDLKFPKDFSYGRIHKLFKYGIALVLMTSFFGWVSWFLLTLKDLPNAKRIIKDFFKQKYDASAPSPMALRLEQREALYKEDTISGKLARLFETPPTMGLVVTATLVLSSLVILLVYIPKGSNQLSQRHLFESYIKGASNNEPLYLYQSPSTKGSVYLKDIKKLNSANDFFQKFKGDTRFFAVIPRERLAAVNAEIRKKLKKNVHVLNAKSNRLVLLSNQLGAGEVDQNFVSKAIVEGDPFKEIDHKVLFKNKQNQMVHPTYDGQLQVLGYSLNHKSQNGKLPAYSGGDEVEVTAYYKVLRQVPTKQKIFMHIDTRGNRLHGDHYPVNDQFSTNYWLPGDVVKDTHTIKIDPYTTKGNYLMNVGFYIGSKRMKVEPRSAHDGKNRLKLGSFAVTR